MPARQGTQNAKTASAVAAAAIAHGNARKAHRTTRRDLAGLVRGLHGSRAVRRQPAAVKIRFGRWLKVSLR